MISRSRVLVYFIISLILLTLPMVIAPPSPQPDVNIERNSNGEYADNGNVPEIPEGDTGQWIQTMESDSNQYLEVEENDIPEFPSIVIPLASILVFALLFKQGKN